MLKLLRMMLMTLTSVLHSINRMLQGCTLLLLANTYAADVCMLSKHHKIMAQLLQHGSALTKNLIYATFKLLNAAVRTRVAGRSCNRAWSDSSMSELPSLSTSKSTMATSPDRQTCHSCAAGLVNPSPGRGVRNAMVAGLFGYAKTDARRLQTSLRMHQDTVGQMWSCNTLGSLQSCSLMHVRPDTQ